MANARGSRIAPAARAQISLTLYNGMARLVPTTYLGGSQFNDFLAASQASGAAYQPHIKSQVIPLHGVRNLIDTLRSAGFLVQVSPQLLEAIHRADPTPEKSNVEKHLDWLDSVHKEHGLALFKYQREGVKFLHTRKAAALFDAMGCVADDTIIQVNRAGRGFKIRIDDLYNRFHRKVGSWQPGIRTTAKALCGDELRQHEIMDVVFSGRKQVVKITTESGKEITLTPDHEVACPGDRWIAAINLRPGDEVLINGKPLCLRCGSDQRVAVGSQAKFPGYCKTCICRYLRHKQNYVNGKCIDSDGYVRVGAQYEHPRRNQANQVYEHILAMEKHHGRPISTDEHIHHINKIKSDNRIENLEILTPGDHQRKHKSYLHLNGGLSSKGGLVSFVPKIDHIQSIEDAGERDTYDLIMADPYRSFIGSGIIVHNCGKTSQAISAAQPNAPVLIVCPAVVKGNWAKEIKMWRNDLDPHIVSGRGKFHWPIKGQALITNFDILPKATRSGRFGYSLDKDLGSPLAGTVCIIDEIHRAKSSKALRTQALKAITKAVRSHDGRVWGLTGTPLINRPPELWTILDVIGVKEEAFGSWEGFVRMFSGKRSGFRGAFEWGMPQPAVVECIKRVSLRRTLEAVQPDLPAIRYQNIMIDIDSKTQAQCDKALELLSKVGISLEEAMSLSIENKDRKIAFQELSLARKMLAVAKIPFALEIIEDFEDAGEPLVVFSAMRPPIDVLEKRLGWGVITGSVSNTKRTQLIDDFQSGRLKYIGATIAAGGVGITLTNAAYALFIDSSWTFADNSQAVKRIRRIGQKRGQLVKWLVANHKLDEQINRIVFEKMRLSALTIEASSVGGSATVETDDITRNVEIVDGKTHGTLGRLMNGRRQATTDIEKWAQQSVASLALADPDHAQSRNDRGFDRIDADMGHSLVTRFTIGLTEEEWEKAIQLATKYRKQMGLNLE